MLGRARPETRAAYRQPLQKHEHPGFITVQCVGPTKAAERRSRIDPDPLTLAIRIENGYLCLCSVYFLI